MKSLFVKLGMKSSQFYNRCFNLEFLIFILTRTINLETEMKIEEAIQQKSFRTEGQKLNINFIYTYSWLINQQKPFYIRFGVTMQQYNVLRILRGKYPEPYSTHMIRDRMLDKMSDVSND